MFRLFRYSRQIVAFILVLPELFAAIEEIATKIQKARADGDVTKDEALDILQSGLDKLVRIFGLFRAMS